MTNADTSQSLRWQCNANGDATKLARWKVEATAIPGLQFLAYMQPSEAFLVVGHTLSTIYSTTTDVTNYHGKVILFTGNWTGTREYVPVVLPPLAAFAWKKCLAVKDWSKLAEWYTDNHTEYGNLWDPTPQDGPRTKLLVPRMIALPPWAAKLYHNFNGAVMPMNYWPPLNSTWQARPQPLAMGMSGDWFNDGCWWRCRGTTAGETPQKGSHTSRSIQALSCQMIP